MSVIHIKEAPSGWEKDSRYVYIGRPGKGLEGPYGNPFILTKESDRARIMGNYIDWLDDKLSLADQYATDDPYNAWNLKQLAFKTLVCFCKPKLCHGDILMFTARLLNEYT